MQRLISAVTALSVALYVVPPFVPTAALAEGTSALQPMDANGQPIAVPTGAFVADLNGQAVICLPKPAIVCPDGALCVVAKVEAGCLKKAAAKLAKAAAAADGAATVDAAAPDATAPAADAAPDAAAQATVDAAAPDATAPDTTAPDAAATDATAGTAEAATPPAPEPAPAPDATTAEAPAATADTTADTNAGTAPAAPQVITLNSQDVICLPADKSVKCDQGAICVRPKTMANCQVAAQRKLDALAANAAEDKAAIDAQKAAADAAAAAALAAGQPLVDAPKPDEQAVQTLDATLAAPSADQPDATASGAGDPAPAPAAAAAAASDSADAAPAADAVVAQETVTAADTRASTQEFAAAPAVTADGKKKTGLSDLEKVGLVALGALVVGQMLKGQKEVVSNSGDRVVVKDPAGNYQVYKDDDTLLRQPGANVRTETFKDGSTRTTVVRVDGTRIVTVRDASGRVLRRSAFDAKGLETVLIDDTIPEQKVDVSKLPPPSKSAGSDPELAAALAAVEAQKAGRKFSLRQIRMIPEVKALATAIPVDNVTFESGSAAIRPDQAEALAALGDAVKRMIKKNPGKVFLIEGHTDAVGGAPMNLTLSDRRAESVAKALTEYFGVPPENLVVQGYGEAELMIDTQASERANRRVVVRDVTPLLRQARN